ncbi:MAG: M61 family metallopeptidase [Deltaproteobacteria bacterium]|nr:M61 family metallopeptidase [Deltaproteobacteria bacterium]
MRLLATTMLSLSLLGCGSTAPAPVDSGAAPHTAPLPTPDGEGVIHRLRITDPASHVVEVSSVFPTHGASELTLYMAVWTPGSYLVREYARNIESVSASDLEGAALSVEKVRKNRWRVSTGGAAYVAVRYRLYARELSVRTNFIDPEVVILQGAATYLSVVGGDPAAQRVELSLPEGYGRCATAMASDESGMHFTAPTWDALVDSPIVCGDLAVHEFRVDDTPIRLVDLGEHELFDGERAAGDLERVVATQVAFWGETPFARYSFLNVLLGGGGGLEHLDSTLLLADRFATRRDDDYRRWLGLASHELFHAWNGKRARPLALGPFDYETENPTRSLWIVEGITAYYDDLLLARAGLLNRDQYLAALSTQIRRLGQTPGRLVQPLAMASYDAWIKYYRPDENSANSRVSYYAKGAVVAFLLDATIREATQNSKSLDDLMRALYARASGPRGYTEQEFRDLATQIAGQDLSSFFTQNVDRVGELPLAPALNYLGLRLKAAEAPGDQPPAWLGADLETRAGRLVVKRVLLGTPAHEAGLDANDELLAVGEERVPTQGLDELLEHFRPDAESTLLVARRGRLLRLPVTFGTAPRVSFDLEADPAATGRAQQRLRSWLGEGVGRREPAGE